MYIPFTPTINHSHSCTLIYLRLFSSSLPLSVPKSKTSKFCSICKMGRFLLIAVWSLSIGLWLYPHAASAQLKQNYYANICPNVENIVRGAVQKKFQQTFVTVPATIRLFFHDCFVQVKLIDQTMTRKKKKKKVSVILDLIYSCLMMIYN